MYNLPTSFASNSTLQPPHPIVITIQQKSNLTQLHEWMLKQVSKIA